jgi:hypothetical protein
MLSTIIIAVVFLPIFLAWKIYSTTSVNRLLSLGLCIAIFIWYSIPGLIFALSKSDTLPTPFYRGTNWPADFSSCYILESLAVCVVLAIVLLNHGRNKSSTRIESLSKGLNKLSEKQKKIILVLFSLVLVYQASTSSGNYLQNNSADLYGTDSSTILLVVAKQITFAMVALIAIYERENIFLVRGAFGLVIFSSFIAGSGGERLELLAPVFIYFFRLIIDTPIDSSETKKYVTELSQKIKNLVNRKFRLGLNLFLILLFVWFVFLPIANSIQNKRAEGVINWSEIIDDTFKNKDSEKDVNAGQIAAGILFTKLDSYTPGFMLVKEAGSGSAGVTPYIGSFLVFVPRIIMPERPIAGTSDGTIASHPTRLVPALIGIQSDSLNVGVSPLHIALWHFGYLGFAVFVFGCFLQLKFVNWLLNSKSFLYNSFGVSSISIPLFSTIFLSPDMIVRNLVTICLYLTLIKFTRLFAFKKK